MSSSSIRTGVIAVVLSLSTLGTATALARAHHGSCYDRAQTQAALTQCAQREARRNQLRVTTAFAALIGTLSGSERADALADERAWQRFVTANCRSASNSHVMQAGSMAPMNDLLCQVRRAEQRADYLRWRVGTPEQRERRPMP